MVVLKALVSLLSTTLKTLATPSLSSTAMTGTAVSWRSVKIALPVLQAAELDSVVVAALQEVVVASAAGLEVVVASQEAVAVSVEAMVVVVATAEVVEVSAVQAVLQAVTTHQLLLLRLQTPSLTWLLPEASQALSSTSAM